jgi:tight adherence protein B
VRCIAAILAYAALLLPGLVQPAHAAGELVVSDVRVDASVRSLDLRLSAQGLPSGAGLNAPSVTAQADGRTLPAASVVPAAQTEVEPPRVLLLVDTTGSMAGQPMVEAKQAISTFVAQAPVEVPLGVMAYASTARMLVPPTLDRSTVLGAVAGLQAQGQTALYDALGAAVASLGTVGDRRIVLLSDGEDNLSRTPLEAVLAATAASGVTVDAVGFRTGKSVEAVLQRIASSGRGRVHAAASSAELSSALASTVHKRATALDVRLLVPEDLRGVHSLTLTAGTTQGPLSTTVDVQLGEVATAAAPRTGWWGTQDALLVGLAAIAASLALASLVLLGGGRRRERRTQTLLDRYTTQPAKGKADAREASPVARTALELADRLASKRQLQDKIGLRLSRAAVSWTPAEWLLLQFGIACGSVLVLVLLGWNLLVALVAGVAAGGVLPTAYLRFRGGRRLKAFENQLPDALQMSAGSLSAGYSLPQALDGIVREGSEPMATEIGKALAESRLGVPIEQTLDGVAERMDSRDFGWVVMAIRVQREVGGNLGGVLTSVSATMRERAMLRRHVRGLSAEGRLSAYILIALPVLLTTFMVLVRRDYIEPLYTTVLGYLLIGVALVMLSIGSFVMSRLVKVEV